MNNQDCSETLREPCDALNVSSDLCFLKGCYQTQLQRTWEHTLSVDSWVGLEPPKTFYYMCVIVSIIFDLDTIEIQEYALVTSIMTSDLHRLGGCCLGSVTHCNTLLLFTFFFYSLSLFTSNLNIILTFFNDFNSITLVPFLWSTFIYSLKFVPLHCQTYLMSWNV